jgi:hypothetical protein
MFTGVLSSINSDGEPLLCQGCQGSSLRDLKEELIRLRDNITRLGGKVRQRCVQVGAREQTLRALKHLAMKQPAHCLYKPALASQLQPVALQQPKIIYVDWLEGMAGVLKEVRGSCLGLYVALVSSQAAKLTCF